MHRTLAILASLALPFACSSDDDDDDGVAGVDGGLEPAADAGPAQKPPAELTEGVATLAGGPVAGATDGDRNVASFHNPVNTTVGPDGNIYVADFDNSLIRMVTPLGRVSTLSPGDEAFFRPFGLTFAPDETLYVQTDGDTAGGRDGALWTVDTDSGRATLVRDMVGRMRGLAALPDGRIAMAEYQQHYIAIFDPARGSVTNIAGRRGEAGNADGLGDAARFDAPYDLVVTDDGDLVVSDWANHRLRRVTLAGEVTTLAGTGMPGDADGPLASAELNYPQGLALHGDSVYVSDTGGYVIREVDLDAGEVRTIAGNGQPGFRDSEDPLGAQFFGLEGLDVDADGVYLYVADGNRGENDEYHRVRRVSTP